MTEFDFAEAFHALAGNPPFPWQTALFERLCEARADNIPASCNLPTGLGKTSVIHVWLLALASGAKVPRRLVYVVNRRTVVDQTTTEVEKLRDALPNAPTVNEALWELCALKPKEIDPKKDRPLAISTLRGQFADNREWSADPARPAVICGTVDMIGSRLLFSGYGCGFRTRPLHAGFLGQDALIVHDEAHLEPAFQELLLAIQAEQSRAKDFRPLRVMELTATSRAGAEKPFELTDDDKKNSVVRARINATKKLQLHESTDDKKVAEQVATKAMACGEKFPGSAILVFVRSVRDVQTVIGKLPTGSCEQLTGTLRGYERDGLVKRPIFQRFLPESNRDKDVPRAEGTVYLVCTSAGEVGVNISADHLVCDLSTFESMAQRFGRVNRFGECPDTEVHVVYPKEFDTKDELDVRRARTLALLRELGADVSPAALGKLVKAKREGTQSVMSGDQTAALRDYIAEAYSPSPTIVPTSDILFDAWALTSVRELPGRPPVAEYLHGIEDEKKRETAVVWREEVTLFDGTAVTEEQIAELLDTHPIRAHETLRDATYRLHEALATLGEKHPELPVWVIDPDDTVRVLRLGQLAAKNKKEYAENLSARTVVLPPEAGGLTATGTLSGTEAHNPERFYDVAGRVSLPSGAPLVRMRVTASDDERTFRLVAPVLGLPDDFHVLIEGTEAGDLRTAFTDAKLAAMRVAMRLDLSVSEDDEPSGTVEYVVLKPEWKRKESKHDAAWPALDAHLAGVSKFAKDIAERSGLPTEVVKAAELAGLWHDLGKDRGVWQRGAGNTPKHAPVAKTLHGRAPENLNHFRHELASMVDVQFDPAYRAAFDNESEACRELVLHLIATHHGRGRPHFPEQEATDPERPASAAAALVSETPRRFGRLQRKYGRWGLAYLESLLRAADALDSQRIEDTPIGDRAPGAWPRKKPEGVSWVLPSARPSASIRVNVDATNPGQFFACCGLLELADRLWPGAEGWFEDRQFFVACAGDMTAFLSALCSAECTRVDVLENGIETSELLAPLRLPVGTSRPITLDAWTALRVEKGEVVFGANPPWNFWSGNQKSHPIWSGLMTSLVMQAKKLALEQLAGLFNQRLFQKGRFGFDPGPAWNALDVGFSPNEQSIKVESSSATELLALVGLQRFRPRRGASSYSFTYATWGTALPPQVAAAAACGEITCPPTTRYRGRAVDRGQYRALTYSTILSGGIDE